MKAADWLVSGLIWLGIYAFLSADAAPQAVPRPAPAPVEIATSGEYPVDVVTIRSTMSSRGRVCVEPEGGGRVMCVSVGELRDWMGKRAKAK